MTDIQIILASEFSLTVEQVAGIVALIEAGNTIPFIARYRKEKTGGTDDVTLRELDERLSYLKNLEARKAEVLRLIDERGELTPELRSEIERAEVLQRVEDLYKPYKKKRATRATKAKDAGLAPLALFIAEQSQTSGEPLAFAEPYINAEKGYDTPEAALSGACDIIAELVSDDAEHTAVLRDLTRKRGSIVSEAADADEKSIYEMYRDFSEPILKIPNHRVLAINRGEKEGKLKVKVQTDAIIAVGLLEKRVIKDRCIFTELLKATLTDSYKRLIAPSLEREVRAELTERAEAEAIKVFAKNTENLLLQPPVKDARIIALDPGYRTGCKVAVLDEYGKLSDHATVYPTPPKSDIEGAKRVLRRFAEKYDINIIVIGNGTGSRETEEAVADFISESALPIEYTIVNEAGASVYSASKLASEEYPDLEPATRGAMSLGRRLQDPLAELVKIPPRSIGVGQYQHDLNQTALDRALTGVVENAVNRVGVDLNTASASLLGFVAGIGDSLAKNIVAYREENGAFSDRKQLKKVPKLGNAAFTQCAGFLRIQNGANPLDSTAVHPESYAAAELLLKRAGVSAVEIAGGGIPDIAERAGDPNALADELGVGLPTLRDIVSELARPGRDPREDAPPVVFSRAVRSIDDLTVGAELTGIVRNVVDFGAFVDIGVKQDGLVHVSKLSARFIRHPSEVVAVGDNVKVRVLSVDKERGKISLTMAPEKQLKT
ncbi:MAG: RNA-binding transcriptional accessory protein [Oscillospiraceae bacterium]|nr:RNA-binding transcriptional accessory protein [Oscillospiraceae bacterium]